MAEQGYKKCYTLGYLDGCTVQDLLGYLDLLHAVLVDIRFSPWSSNPAWRQNPLRDRLGADYIYCHAFGNKNYRNGGPIALFAPEAGLRQVAAILVRRPVILLCACREIDTCHRKAAAELLAARLGVAVEHLPGNLTRWAERGEQIADRR